MAKHGNRSISSRVGSADVLSACGVAIDLDPASAGRTLDEVGLVFLFAPAFHPAMKELALIGVTLALPGGMTAKIAVLGPMRMQYEKVMGAVLHIGREFVDVG